MGKPLYNEKELMKLPLGATSFAELRNLDRIYVDKTDLIYSLALNISTPVFLARPRRFGKSLLVSTFESLFAHGLRDFKDLAIEKLWTENKTYKVVHLDFSLYADLDAEQFKNELIDQLENEFSYLNPARIQKKDSVRSAAKIFDNVAKNTRGKNIVLLIDEYDSPITHHLDDLNERKKIERVHSNFFAAVKRYEEIFRFVFITGITRTSHVSLFSIFNSLQDITLDDEYATLTGITEDEIHQYFDPYVRNAASVLDLDTDAVYEKLRHSYDGFQFSLNSETKVHNPWSLLCFLVKPANGFQNYWYQSSGGVPSLLVNYLKKQDNLELFSNITKGEHTIEINRLTAKSKAELIPIDLLLLQTGYYTLREGSYLYARLVLPNDEVSDSVISLSLDIHNLNLSFESSVKLGRITSLIDTGAIGEIVELFNTILTECLSPGSKAFNDKNVLRDVIYSRLPDKGLIKSREKPNSCGYSDLELKTASSRLVIEFKRSYQGITEDQALKNALTQIKERHYGEGTDCRKLIRAAMVFSATKKAITKWCVIE